MTDTGVDTARATMLEQAKRATAQASKHATRVGAAGRTGPAYTAWRTELVLQHRIPLDELRMQFAIWRRDRKQFDLLVGLGFDNPADVDLQSTLEAMVQLAEKDLRELARTVPPDPEPKRLLSAAT